MNSGFEIKHRFRDTLIDNKLYLKSIDCLKSLILKKYSDILKIIKIDKNIKKIERGIIEQKWENIFIDYFQWTHTDIQSKNINLNDNYLSLRVIKIEFSDNTELLFSLDHKNKNFPNVVFFDDFLFTLDPILKEYFLKTISDIRPIEKCFFEKKKKNEAKEELAKTLS